MRVRVPRLKSRSDSPVGKAKANELDEAYSAACQASNDRQDEIAEMDPNEVTLDVLRSNSYMDAAGFCAASDIRNGAALVAQFLAGTYFSKDSTHPEVAAELTRQANLIRKVFGEFRDTGR